jgi:hypothetical protein
MPATKTPTNLRRDLELLGDLAAAVVAAQDRLTALAEQIRSEEAWSGVCRCGTPSTGL